jgi:alpha-methylacyl-CoA racemase
MGPLEGVKVVELAGIGPGPFCAMMLADMGAEVIRVDRPDAVEEDADLDTPHFDLLRRGRPSLAVDLKRPEGLDTLLRLIDQADALVEGFRPGVTERLGFGPDVCLERNPKLVYGRMTGWGQDGPIAHAAGHDINYIALVGALEPIGRPGTPPVAPLNLVGDFGGGGMFLAYGIACGLFEAKKSGRGQVIDAAMIDGSALLMTMFYGLKAAGMWRPKRASNFLDTGSHFYDSYETADGKYVSVGSIEPKFYEELIEKLGIAGEDLPGQNDASQWPTMRDRVTALFRSKTRDEWCELMEGSDVCFAPVLSLDEAPEHPHNKHRGTFTEVAGVTQPEVGPRFSRTPGAISQPPAHPGQHTEQVLADWGFSGAEIAKLREAGAIR